MVHAETDRHFRHARRVNEKEGKRTLSFGIGKCHHFIANAPAI